MILLMNREKNHQKEALRDSIRKSLVDNADSLVRKRETVTEVDKFFQKMNQDQMSKASEIDPQFLEFLNKNKISPTKVINGEKQLATVIDVLKNSQLSDKIYMFKKVDENTDGYNMIAAQRQQIMKQNQGVIRNKYYNELVECHKMITDHYN